MSDSSAQTEDKLKSHLHFKNPHSTTWFLCWDYILVQCLLLSNSGSSPSIPQVLLPQTFLRNLLHTNLHLRMCFLKNPIWQLVPGVIQECKLLNGLLELDCLSITLLVTKKMWTTGGGLLIVSLQGSTATVKTLTYSELEWYTGVSEFTNGIMYQVFKKYVEHSNYKNKSKWATVTKFNWRQWKKSDKSELKAKGNKVPPW